MRISIIIIFLILYAQASHADEAVILKGKCHSVKLENHNNINNNSFAICIENEKVTARMLFSNPGKFPAVCYQSGHLKATGKNSLQIKLNKGYCDNSNEFYPDVLECTSNNTGILKCISPHGKLTLKHEWNH